MALRNLVKWTLSARLYSSAANSNLVEKLSTISVAKYLGNIDELLTAVPELRRYSPEQWEKSLTTLKELGFNPTKLTNMIAQNPSLMARSREKIESAMNNWYFLDFGQKDTFQLLERYPEFLDVKNINQIHENLDIVKSLVGQKHGYKVLRNSPGIVTDSPKSLEAKAQYLRDVMRVDPVEVYKSEVFSLDLFTIKARHVFLDRLGMWFRRKKKDEESEAHEAKKNPKLSTIMDSSNKKFATKVCHVTLEEYETFLDMYREELEKTEDETEREMRNKKDGGDENFEDDDVDKSHIYFSK